MESNSKFSASLEHGSEFVYDHICLLCCEDGRNSEANHFCQECGQCYCDVCIHHHNIVLKKHTVLGRKDVDKWSTATALVDPLVRCEKHPEETLKLKCLDHRQLCCHLCVSVNHRQCREIVHIQDAAKGFSDTQEIRELPKRVSELRKQLAHELQSRKDNIDALDKSGDDCLNQIQSLRQMFNDVFDRLERQTVADMESRKTSLGNEIQADVDRIDDVTDKLQKSLDAFKDGVDTNKVLSYIGFTKCDKVISNAQLVLQNIADKEDLKLSFEPFKEITEITENLSLERLGDVICIGVEKPLPGLNHVFEVEKHVLHNVKMTADGTTALVDDDDFDDDNDDDKEEEREELGEEGEVGNVIGIAGMCRLATGEFLLSDIKNSKIKLLNNTFDIISTIDVPNTTDVCCTGQREAAVGVDDGEDIHEILLVRVHAGKIEQKRTIKLQHTCDGLARHGDHIYTTTGTGLYVFDMALGHDRQLYSDETGEITVYGCAVSPDGSCIYITNIDHHQFITLNKDGTKLSTLTHPELKDSQCVHVSPRGHVFVSCTALGSVVQVGIKEDGTQTVTTIAGKNNELTAPFSLCFNSSSNTLVVGEYCGNKIVELKLK